MTVLFEYLGFFVLAILTLLGGLLLLPEIGVDTGISIGETGRLLLGVIILVGGFSWFYFPALREADNP